MRQPDPGVVGVNLGAAIAKAAKTTTSRSAGRSVAKSVKSAARKASGSSRSSSSSRGYSGGSSGSSRSSSGRSSGGGGGGKSSVPRSTPKPKPVAPPSINSFLGTDAAYQDVIRGGKRSLADFLSEMGRRRGEAGTQFNMTKSSMERDRTQQLEDMRNEYASRGLIQSGIYADEQGKFQKQFAEQLAALEQQQGSLMADLLGQETNYRREQELALEAAKQQALQRRAARYNIGA